MIHEIKIDKTFVRPILDGDKTFEIRLNDRGYQRHDRVCFKVNEKGNGAYQSEIRKLENSVYVITYVINGWGLENGYVVFGIRECADAVMEGTE